MKDSKCHETCCDDHDTGWDGIILAGMALWLVARPLRYAGMAIKLAVLSLRLVVLGILLIY